MSPQDKATTERHARILRELVKRPENRVCADCKHNDPRWASWNIGVFLCIRCSGIHRGMGTHISKVKSIDLDTWTAEQMACIQKWGNRLANLYWEAHLKPGHVPPDHKIESFIRSKYESRRWALDGLPPSDPAALEGGSSTGQAASGLSPTLASGPTPVRANPPVLQPSVPTVTHATTMRHSQPHQLLSAQYARGQVIPQSTPTLVTPTSAPAPKNDLFSLDFHTPPVNATSTTDPTPAKDAKQDILSLFGAQTASSPWSQAQVPVAQLQSLPLPPFRNTTATSSTTNWNVGHSWSNPVPPVQPNVWGAITPGQQPSLLSSGSDIWGGPTDNPTAASVGMFASSTSASNTQTKKEDVFEDIWGSFK
ncbi:ArfGap-domain-containing protein [Russula earlei]|uniref:ArfGap-domain-containing protein n=1 Tax=Russula earlei TaxID=71964 RepID=A0ACC0UHV1_9AGAM|nr:ArfGap-domain-containing protein [Russula earlei]